jgi:hypothetical protein
VNLVGLFPIAKDRAGNLANVLAFHNTERHAVIHLEAGELDHRAARRFVRRLGESGVNRNAVQNEHCGEKTSADIHGKLP